MKGSENELKKKNGWMEKNNLEPSPPPWPKIRTPTKPGFGKMPTVPAQDEVNGKNL